MEIIEYKQIIHETAIYPKSTDDFGKCYTLFGLLGEASELMISTFLMNRKEIVKESGDVLWYITAMCKEFDIIFELLFENDFVNRLEQDNENVQITIGSVTEDLKKYYRDGKALDLTKISLFLLQYIELIRNVIDHYNDYNQHNPITMEEVMETNYNKLIKRRQTGTLQGDGDNREEQ